jgi:hypothetical protein
MPITTKIIASHGLAHLKGYQKVTTIDLFDQHVKYMRPLVEKGFISAILIDSGEVEHFEFDREVMLDLLGEYRMISHKGYYCSTALYAPSDLIYGIGRMTEVYAVDIEYNFSVFRWLNEALEFLGHSEAVLKEKSIHPARLMDFKQMD